MAKKTKKKRVAKRAVPLSQTPEYQAKAHREYRKKLAEQGHALANAPMPIGFPTAVVQAARNEGITTLAMWARIEDRFLEEYGE